MFTYMLLIGHIHICITGMCKPNKHETNFFSCILLCFIIIPDVPLQF
uniref:Uncharacterized protein n=1 Tax=Anguilla anguilla TaxID=7936 RepID=A0A0E9SYB2_ANGAN